jgi:hypothetical protein
MSFSCYLRQILKPSIASMMTTRALITGPATLLPPFYPAARRGGLNGAGGRSTDCKIAANIERGF